MRRFWCLLVLTWTLNWLINHILIVLYHFFLECFTSALLGGGYLGLERGLDLSEVVLVFHGKLLRHFALKPW